MNEKTSGQGDLAAIPDEIRGWNWGACLLGWIWAIGNGVQPVWLIMAVLLAFVPFGSVVVSIFFGLRGTEWAWRHKKWESIEQFKRTQKTWMIWGIVIESIGFTLLVVVFVFMWKAGSWL